MDWYTQLDMRPVLIFALVLMRIGGLVFTAPIFGGRAAPAQVRALLALALAALVAPLQWGKPLELPVDLVHCLLAGGAELLVGATLGMGILLLFSGLQLAGQIVSQMSGIQLADVFDPSLDTNVPAFSHLMLSVTTAVFVTIGGHRRVLEALLDTFAWLPAGRGAFSAGTIVEAMTSLTAQSFTLGIRAAAPAMAALLVATLLMGLVSRTMPQLNIAAFGFGLNALVALGALSVSLGAVAWIFQEQFEPMLNVLSETWQPR